MKTSELKDLLEKLGAKFLRHGKSHDIWINPKTGDRTRIWRHAKEVPTGTLNQILKDLGYK
ncbi:MAG: type II toxin-antitoxin system HicA family toxin [Selenomonadaceae bacterium]|nr:type II toxin-antitoxin system HicA family toxin [Selenomonadaceae bacterium]